MTSAHPVVFNPYDYDFHEDPYPTYARLRAKAPLYRNDELDFYALSRHADVSSAFRDSARFSSAMGVSLDPTAYGPHAYKTMSFLAMDDPRHNQLRRLVNKGFTPRRVTRLADRIQELTDEHWGACLNKQTIDFVDDFAGKLPMDVISELMGVPVGDRAELRRLADLVMHREEGSTDLPQESAEAALELIAYYQQMVAERRAHRTDDLTSALLDAEVDGEQLSEDELLSFLFLMVVAGNETTTKLLANAMYWADRHPHELAKVYADPDLVTDWVEETLRFDTSSQMVLRTTTTDVDIAGGTIPSGSKVLLLIGSANRDEEVFGDGVQNYCIGRDSSEGLMSFGVGTHFCLGAHLARLEANIALRTIIRTTTGFTVHNEGIERVHSSNVRGFAHLPMTLEVR